MEFSPPPGSAFASVGQLLKFLRRRARLSQRELSIAVGYSESHLSRIENNQRPVDRASLLALFVPALEIQDEPETVQRLLALCDQARRQASDPPSASARVEPDPRAFLAPRNRLPVQLTSFVGRREEVAELRDLLADNQTRLLSLTGAGGCGKTRLALRVGEEIAPRFPDGVWLVELAPLMDPQLVVKAAAEIFDLQEGGEAALLASLQEFLRQRQALLILDNCEHLIEATAHLAATLLQACPGLQILATSRETLSVPGEIVYPVQPLALPPRIPGDQPAWTEVAEYDAIRLFTERARDVLRSFALTDQTAPAAARICQRLDGMPLGIELAASWLRVLSPEQIAVRLESSFDLLDRGQRALLPRHQTLQAAIDWSVNLLSTDERAMLLRLAVFGGGWTLEAAEAVAGGVTPLDPAAVLSLLQRLVEKSLVAVERSTEDEVRYRFLEPIREYARQQLAANGTEAAIRDRHLAYFVDLAEKAEPRLKSAQQLYWLAVLDQEQENARAALSHSLSGGNIEAGLRLAGALGHYWEMRFNLGEGRRWCEALIGAAAARGELAGSPWRAKVLLASAIIDVYQYEMERARPRLDESLAIYRELGDVAGAGAALCFVAITQDELQEPQQALRTYAEAIQCAQRAEDTWWIAETLH